MLDNYGMYTRNEIRNAILDEGLDEFMRWLGFERLETILAETNLSRGTLYQRLRKECPDLIATARNTGYYPKGLSEQIAARKLHSGQGRKAALTKR